MTKCNHHTDRHGHNDEDECRDTAEDPAPFRGVRGHTTPLAPPPLSSSTSSYTRRGRREVSVRGELVRLESGVEGIFLGEVGGIYGWGLRDGGVGRIGRVRVGGVEGLEVGVCGGRGVVL